MAALANPLPGFDFSPYEDFSAASYPSDPLTHFFQPLSLPPEMDQIDFNSFNDVFSTQSDLQRAPLYPTAPQTIQGKPTHHAHLMHPSHPNPFAVPPTSFAQSSGSDTANSIASGTSSSLGSPALHSQYAQQFASSGNSNASDFMTAPHDATEAYLETYDAAFAEYQSLVSDDKASGFVGESPSVGSRGLFSNLPVSSASSVVPSPFKKPLRTATLASSSSRQSTASPATVPSSSYSSHAFPHSQDPARNVPAVPRSRGNSVLRSPSLSYTSSSAPNPSLFSSSNAQDWATPTTPLTAHSFNAAQNQYFSSPTQQEPESFEIFQASPISQTPQNFQFFHQSSGNYVAPLDSSYPSLLQPAVPTPSSVNQSFNTPQVPQTQSPALSHSSSQDPSRTGSYRMKSSRSQSPYMTQHGWQPYPQSQQARRLSSHRPQPSSTSRSESLENEDAEREKGKCPHPECGKIFRDLKAHMLTHQNERPEKCPIASCEYSKKGFSRKYDKNRHTLTHYKGTMVCGFCPHSGSSAEKSFNRADVFKRHLTTVHGVEQNPPNSRKKTASGAGRAPGNYAQDATGKCSICSGVFQNAQDFYEHLEDCVLSVVQKTDPSEAINEQLLTSINDDDNVKETLERHHLPTALDSSVAAYSSGEDENEDSDDDEDEGSATGPRNTRAGRGSIRSRRNEASASDPLAPSRGSATQAGGGAITKASQQSSSRGPAGGRGPTVHRRGEGLTYSKGGVALSKHGRKRRKNYPVSWGCAPEKMKMKKRVLTVWDGPRRLAKDDMMLGADFEVRLQLPGADDGSYITDLDVQTLRRAEAFHNATEEERGPWNSLTNAPEGYVPTGLEGFGA